jgi:alginate O-acetyltransferase complex protein AlgI
MDRLSQLRQQPLAAGHATAIGPLGAATVAGIAPATKDVRQSMAIRATPHFWPFVALVGQLTILIAVFRLYHLETAAFSTRGLYIIFGAFFVHYWVPLRFKEPFLVTVSLAAAFYVLGAVVAALLIAAGMTFFLILRSPLLFRWRVGLLVSAFGLLMYGCLTRRLPIPGQFYPVFGAIFMFRIIIYAYDLAHQKEPARLLPFLSYFFILPNYYFTLFPVIDFQTMRRTYYQREIDKIAQQGIHWMVRGTVQLMLYRLVFYLNDNYLPDRVTSFSALLSTMVLTYLLYLNVSGRFHLIIGMLHLFGYDLPETNRRYLLASSFTDYWRRINIYWKDFMLKIVYFPVYFKFRRSGDTFAKLVATIAVFLVTWALHAYQSMWIVGQVTTSWPDTIFWTILGLLVIGNVLYDGRHRLRKRTTSWQASAVQAVQVLGTFLVMITLWSLWSSPTVNSWIYLMTHWTQVKR